MYREINSARGVTALREAKHSKAKQLASVITVFILSRLIYYCVGIRFDATPLAHFWQYIDINLLSNNLLQSLYYLHSQPPLFNLFLGLALKFFANHLELVFTVAYLLLGLLFTGSLYLLMHKLGVPDKLNILLAALYIISPAVVLYENILFYTYPIVALLCVSALCLNNFLLTKRLKDGLIFFACSSLIPLTISMFHLLWFALILILVFVCDRCNWKRIALACCIPLALVFFLYLKNLHVFGIFTSSSWFGMNFARMTIVHLPEQENKALVRRGEISVLSLIPPFSDLEKYQLYFRGVKKTNIEVLDQEIKTGGGTNFNNVAFIDISREYLKNSVHILFIQPKSYIKSLMISYWHYFRPSTYWRFLENNRNKILALDRFYNLFFCGQFLRNNLEYDENNAINNKHGFLNMGLFLLIGYPLLALYGFRLICKACSSKPIDLPYAGTLSFLLLNIGFL